jgi:hypothetical protein
MELSAEQFAQIVRQLEEEPLYEWDDNHRRAPRINRDAKITIVPIINGARGPGSQVMVKNISSRGMAYVHCRAMPATTQFLMKLTRSGKDPLEVLCTVVHCHPAGENRFWIGAEFTCLAPVAGKVDPKESERIRHSMLD